MGFRGAGGGGVNRAGGRGVLGTRRRGDRAGNLSTSFDDFAYSDCVCDVVCVNHVPFAFASASYVN